MKTSMMFLLGMGMGTILGILVAPEAGKITRRKIRDEADKLIDQAMQKKNGTFESNRLEQTIFEPGAPAEVSESRYTY